MLTLTDQAVSAIRDLTAQAGLPPETGLRIAPEDGDTRGLALSLAGDKPVVVAMHEG